MKVRDKISDREQEASSIIKNQLTRNAEDDEQFLRDGPGVPDLNAQMPTAKGFKDGLKCGIMGMLESSVAVPAKATRVRSCTDVPDHTGPCSCQMGTLIYCNQGICSACMFLNLEVDGVRSATCSQCGISTVCTSAKEYLLSPWREMQSDPSERAGATKGSGKKDKQGSKQEAPSSQTETVLAPTPLGELFAGIAVGDSEAMLQKLRRTSIIFQNKGQESGRAVTEEFAKDRYLQYVEALRKALRGDFVGLEATSRLFVVPALDAFGMTYMWSYPGFVKGLTTGSVELDCHVIYHRIARYVEAKTGIEQDPPGLECLAESC